jgi:hypothetical protein
MRQLSQHRRPGDHRGGRAGHEPVPDRGTPGVLGQVLPDHQRVGRQEKGQERHRQRQPVSRPDLGRSRRGGRQNRHLPRRALPRIARRRGKKKAIVAVGRSILIIVWHLLSDPGTQFVDLGPGYYDTRGGTQRAIRNHVRHLEALGYTVTLSPAA